MTRRLPEAVDLVVGGLSVPSHADKQQLLPPDERAAAAARAAKDAGVDVLALFELTDTDSAVLERHGVRVTNTLPNTRTRRKTIRTAVGIRRPWRRRGWVGRLSTVVSDGRNHRRDRGRTIHMPVVGIGRRRGRRREATVISVHAVRKKLDPVGNHDTLEAVAERAERLIARGHRVIVVGDFNRASLGKKGTGTVLRAAGLQLAIADHIDQIWVGPDIEVLDAGVRRDGIKGRISDHPMPWARLRLLPTPRRK